MKTRQKALASLGINGRSARAIGWLLASSAVAATQGCGSGAPADPTVAAPPAAESAPSNAPRRAQTTEPPPSARGDAPAEALGAGVRREIDGTFTKSLCGSDLLPAGGRCNGRFRTDAAGNVMRPDGREGEGVGRWGADDLERAYAIPKDNSEGATVAVLAMGDYANAESDLAVYRAEYGMAPCTSRSGCFTKINRDGATSPLPSAGTEAEIILDLEMVSAGCPDCRIILAEADADWSGGNTAIEHAVARGAQVVTISYGFGGEPPIGSDWLNMPGVSTFVATGDNGYGANQAVYPESSYYVTAVGGTMLQTVPSTARGFSEVGWTSGSGVWGASYSSCSTGFPKPWWQGNTGCSTRAFADVSAAALGTVVYYGGWTSQAGTSASAPLVAGIYAETQLAGWGPELSYLEPGLFTDVSAGIYDDSNGFYFPDGHRATCGGAPVCTVGAGWDGVTGNGTPNGNVLAPNYWAKTYKNSFEGNPSTPGSNASKWWLAGGAGIDVNAGFAIPGEQNDGWVRSTSGWNAVNTWLYTTPGSICDVDVWVRTSQSNFGYGYIAVNNEANTQSLGGTGEFGVLGGDANFAGYQRMSFSFTASDTQEIFYAGFWGNGADAWMQVDDLSMSCKPQINVVDLTSYETGLGFYVQAKGLSNGPVTLWYRGIPGQPAGWRQGATLTAANNQIAGWDNSFDEANAVCTQDQAAGTVTVMAVDGSENQSRPSTFGACNFCASTIGSTVVGCP